MQKLTQFLDINGKLVWFLNKNGAYYIAVKPICEALGVNYHKQYDRLKEHPIFKPECTKQDMQIPGDQRRSYFCISEKFVYGWLTSINSDSPELIDYQRKCYNILYNHFHGSITGLKDALTVRDNVHVEITELQEKLRKENNDFKRIEELKGKQLRIFKTIKEQLDDISTGQFSLSFNE